MSAYNRKGLLLSAYDMLRQPEQMNINIINISMLFHVHKFLLIPIQSFNLEYAQSFLTIIGTLKLHYMMFSID